MGISSKVSEMSDVRGDILSGHSYPFPNSLPLFLHSSIIGEVGEDAVERCTAEESHSGSPVYPKGYFDPSQSCTKLEQDQGHID